MVYLFQVNCRQCRRNILLGRVYQNLNELPRLVLLLLRTLPTRHLDKLHLGQHDHLVLLVLDVVDNGDLINQCVGEDVYLLELLTDNLEVVHLDLDAHCYHEKYLFQILINTIDHA